MKAVFLVIWVFTGPVSSKFIEIKPMPSMQVCESLGQQLAEWIESEDRGRGKWHRGRFRKIWTCIETR